ncbi:MAG: hypothetical protein IT171_01925 [Acidobacteria bacterium]|nr:hypothetical protein [Acidobacteriota bacterium]
MTTDSKPLSKLHKLTSRNKTLMDSGVVELAGCIDCEATFPPSHIEKYIEEYTIDKRVDGRTALCPRCGTDAVIPVRLAENVLRIMHDIYFASTPVVQTKEEAESLDYLKMLLFGDESGSPVLKNQKEIVH